MDAINQTVKDKGYAFLTTEQKNLYNQNQSAPVNPNVISASALTPATPLPKIPTSTPDTTNYNAITASLTPAVDPTTTTTPVDTQLTQAKGTSQGLVDRISQLYGDITGKSTYQAEQEAQLGIPQQQRDLQELTNSLNAIKTEQTLTPIKIQQEFQGRGATAAGVAPIESARNRENAIQALTVSAQMQAKQGNLTLALEQADRATGLKYKAMEDEITAKEKQLALLDKYTLSPLQEEQKRQQELKLAEQKSTLAIKKASEDDFNKNMLSAQQSGMTNLETKQARDLFNAGRIDEANQIIAQYGMAKTLPASAQEYEYAKKSGYKGSFTDYQNEDANRKAVIQRASSTGLPYQVVSQVDKLSSAFDSSPIVKNYNEVQNKKLSVDAIINSGVKGPADLALVFEFMKALDPTSVVRESEYDNASKSGNIFLGTMAKYNGYLKAGGGFLPENVRKDFQTIIDRKLGVADAQYKNLKNETARKINMKTGSSDGSEYLTNYESALTPQGTGAQEDPLGIL